MKNTITMAKINKEAEEKGAKHAAEILECLVKYGLDFEGNYEKTMAELKAKAKAEQEEHERMTAGKRKYRIFDFSKGLMQEDMFIYAKSPKEAVTTAYPGRKVTRDKEWFNPAVSCMDMQNGKQYAYNVERR